jgi:hypothetical protein
LKARGEGSWPVTAGGARGAARLTRPEEGDGPDSRVPPVSGRNEKKKGGRRSWAGGVRVGLAGPVCSRGKEEKASGLKWLRAKEIEEREREREKGFVFF